MENGTHHSSPLPPWLPRILVIGLLLVMGVWAGCTIRLETELLTLLPQSLPSVRGLDTFQKHFASEQEVFLVADEKMSPQEREDAFRKLRPALAGLADVEKVSVPGEEMMESAPELMAWMVWNLPSDQFAKVVAALQPARVKQQLEELPEVLAGALDAEEMQKRQFDPLGLIDVLGEESEQENKGSFIAGQMSERPQNALKIKSRHVLLDFYTCAAFCDEIRDAVQKALPGENRLLLTGRPAFTAEISTRMRQDMLLMMSIAVVLVSAAFWAFYRTFRPLGWILLGQFLSLGVGLIVARVSNGTLNVISMGFASILLGISMDYSILVYHHYASSFRDDRALWARLCRGIWFSAGATSAAFLVLAFSSMPGLRQLSILVTSGLLTSAWLATWLLPAAWSRKPPVTLPLIEKAGDRIASVMTRRGRAILMGALILAVPAVWLLLSNPQSAYSPDLNNFQPSSSAAFRGQMLLAKSDPSFNDAIYIVQAKSEAELKPAAEELVARFPSVSGASVTALLPVPQNQTANTGLWLAGTSPRLQVAFEEAGFGEEWSQSTLAFAAALDRTANHVKAAEAFPAMSNMLFPSKQKGGDKVAALIRIPGAGEEPVPAGGLSVKYGEILPVSWESLKSEVNDVAMLDMKRLGGWALVAIVILCALAQRSVLQVLFNFAALVLSLLMLALLIKITGTQFSALSLLCLPLLLGLIIDYSLHVLMALQHEHGNLRGLYTHIGMPILLTGLASCIGFGAPMLTSQPALQNFGLIMDLGILSAVFSCLFLLPVFCGFFKRSH